MTLALHFPAANLKAGPIGSSVHTCAWLLRGGTSHGDSDQLLSWFLMKRTLRGAVSNDLNTTLRVDSTWLMGLFSVTSFLFTCGTQSNLPGKQVPGDQSNGFAWIQREASLKLEELHIMLVSEGLGWCAAVMTRYSFLSSLGI